MYLSLIGYSLKILLDNLNTLNIAEQKELIIYMTDEDKNLIFKLYEVVSEPLFSGKTVDYKINHILENISKVFIENKIEYKPITEYNDVYSNNSHKLDEYKITTIGTNDELLKFNEILKYYSNNLPITISYFDTNNTNDVEIDSIEENTEVIIYDVIYEDATNKFEFYDLKTNVKQLQPLDLETGKEYKFLQTNISNVNKQLNFTFNNISSTNNLLQQVGCKD